MGGKAEDKFEGLPIHILIQYLADFMVPSFIVIVNDFPLTPGGKIDQKELPIPIPSAIIRGETQKASNEVEERLVSIWKDVLNVSEIGINEDFFKVGGHSLLATQIVSRIRNEFSIDFPLHSIFNAPTILTLATLVKEETSNPKKSRLVKGIARLPRG